MLKMSQAGRKARKAAAKVPVAEVTGAAEHAVESAREAFAEEVVPKVNAVTASLAAGAAAARSAVTEVADNAPAALAVLKGDAVASPKKRRGGKGKWFLLLGALAGGVAIAAYRRSSAKPDPWVTATPWAPPATNGAGSEASSAEPAVEDTAPAEDAAATDEANAAADASSANGAKTD